jgi:uroporphyrinogen-III synthase
VPDARFDGLLITRPQPEAAELAARLADLDLLAVTQPAFTFAAVELAAAKKAHLQRAITTGDQTGQLPLLVFTSTRAVEFALPQLSRDLLRAGKLAAIGPATAAALQAAGLGSVLQPEEGYTSEDLLASLSGPGERPLQAFIFAAQGGRKALLDGLQQSGAKVHELFVYSRQPAAVNKENIALLNQSQRILSVWTSANAMQQLASSLPAVAWRKVCAGEWLVVSPRLAEKATAFGAARVHECNGPGNAELEACVRKLCSDS